MENTLIEKIKHYLTDASYQQAQHFAVQVERLEKLQNYFIQFPDDKSGYENTLARAQKALDYKRPYRIAVIGVTGAGKSTFINALLGRDLVLMKDAGKPATGAALEIFFLEEGEPEIVLVEYRDKSNILGLIDDFVKMYKLDSSCLPTQLNTVFADKVLSLEPQSKITDNKAIKVFEELRRTLADIVNQYATIDINNLRCNFDLSVPSERKELYDLIDENSDLNKKGSTTRKIGLVKTVTYRIQPAQNIVGMQTLQLPRNVCLVDLPGLDGSPLHNIIIREGIKEADAVIYIKGPRRVDTDDDLDLLSDVGRYISLEGSSDSGESIFFVLNARDSIMRDDVPDNLPKDMRDLIDKFLPDYTKNRELHSRGSEGNPYFLISAWAALQAQKALKQQPIEDPDTYESVKVKLRVRDGRDWDVLQASQVPQLVEELTKFARDRRINRQIDDGRQAVNNIVAQLKSKHEREKNQLTRNRVEFSIEQKEEQTLKEQQLTLENIVIDFRGLHLQRLEDYRRQLINQSQTICHQVDNSLKEKMPQLWKNAIISHRNPVDARLISKPILEFILGQTQVNLWDQLSIHTPLLAEHLVRIYTESLHNYQMVHKIANGCYGYIEVSQLESIIKDLIDTNMRYTMAEIARRIAVTRMTDPSLEFTVINSDNIPEKKVLFDTLHKITKIPGQPNVNSEHFNTYIAEVRKQYESFVSGYCVLGILNLYRYEMLLIEERLLEYIRQIFYKIKYADDPILKSKIRSSITIDQNWKRLDLLERKLADLSELNH